MKRRDNNPRAFAETVSISAWRTRYDDASGIADLFIDVVFSEGRIGGEPESPVRFRLSLKRAEVHVVGDLGNVISFPPKDIVRAPIKSVSVRETEKRNTTADLGGKIDLSTQDSHAEVSAGGRKSLEKTNESVIEEKKTALEFQHRVTSKGCAWVIQPYQGGALNGQPWDSSERRMTMKDSSHPRKRGEPPEPRIELRCRREDLHITDIQLKKKPPSVWGKLSNAKRLAVEQYIKDELMKIGFECEDLDDPFAQIVLADVIPEEDG